MQKLRDSLEALSLGDNSFRQAVENVLADVRSDENPHGNLAPNLISLLEECCDGSGSVEQHVWDHQFLQEPLLHCSSPLRPTLRRAMAWRWFITYQVLSGSGAPSAADESEIDAWKHRLPAGRCGPLETRTLLGRTGKEDRPCWWTFDHPDCTVEEDGWCYAHQLSLGPSDIEQARLDEALVEVSIHGESVGPIFKPTSLEGFWPYTLFRPELTGADHGRTVPAEPGFAGRPEVVSASQAYSEVAKTTEEIEVRILPYREPI